jgi:hypothetical protein
MRSGAQKKETEEPELVLTVLACEFGILPSRLKKESYCDIVLMADYLRYKNAEPRAKSSS